MNIRFNKISLVNFMSFAECEIDLQNNGFVTVVGENNNKTDNSKSNGSGKSAIWEGLSWCLTGSTLRGSKDVVRHGETNCEVSVSFSIGADEFKATRLKDKSKSNLLLFKNGEDISGKGIRDTEVLFAQYLPDLTESLLNSTVILGQGLPMRFTNNTPSGRKDVLEKLSKSDFMIEDLKNRVSERKNELSEKMQSVKDTLTKLNTKFDVYDGLFGKKLKEIDELKSVDVDLLKEKYNDLTDQLSDKQTERDEILSLRGIDVQNWVVDVVNEKTVLTSEYNNAVNEINRAYQNEVDPLLSVIKDIEASIKYKSGEITKLKSITDICPTCGQKLPNVHKVDTTDLEKEVADLSADLQSKTTELDGRKANRDSAISTLTDGYKTNIALLDEKISKATADRDMVLRLLGDIESINNQQQKIFDTISGIEENIRTAEKERDNLSKEIDEIKKSAEEYDAELLNLESRLNIQKEFETALKRDFRGILLKNCINYIDTVAKDYSLKIFGTDLIKFELDGNNISISYDGKEYESMSGGEKKKVDVIIQFAIRSMLCKYLGFSCNILVLDEIFDELDSKGCQKVVDFISSEFKDIESVYVISHRSELEIPSDVILRVVKDEDGISRVA